MSSEVNRDRPLGLRIAAIGGLLFLHLPLALILLYAFTTEEKSFQFPPPGYTTKWFGIAWSQRPDIWPPLYLSLEVAVIATFLALIFGTLAAAALSRAKFFGRETISLLFVLPIALPGIITGISLRSAFDIMGIDFSIWTIVLGHATFCIVVVYNNAIAVILDRYKYDQSSGSSVTSDNTCLSALVVMLFLFRLAAYIALVGLNRGKQR